MNDRKSRDRLRFSVVKNLKIVLRQIADAMPFSVAHHYRHQHFVYSRSKRRTHRSRLRRSRLFLLPRLKGRTATKRDPGAKCNRYASCPRSHTLAEQLFRREQGPFCPATARYRTTNIASSNYRKILLRLG